MSNPTTVENASPPASSDSQSLSTEKRAAIEADCLDLICRLEALLSNAIEHRSAGHYSETAELANRMLLISLDFAEAHLQGRVLTETEDRIALAYRRTQHLSDMIDASSWGAFRKVLGRSTSTQDDVVAAHKQVGEALAVSIVSSIGNGIQMIADDSKMASELTQSVTLFVGELKKGW
ncbi:MAG: hypothetical protein AAGA03_11045 [Planctomycetota bacterium]